MRTVPISAIEIVIMVLDDHLTITSNAFARSHLSDLKTEFASAIQAINDGQKVSLTRKEFTLAHSVISHYIDAIDRQSVNTNDGEYHHHMAILRTVRDELLLLSYD